MSAEPSSGDAVVLRVGDRREQDQRVGLVLAEGGHEIGDPALEQVVAEVHDERALPQEGLGGEHRVREPERLVLEDVGDAHAEARAVAGGLFDLRAGLRAMMIPTSSMPASAIASIP